MSVHGLVKKNHKINVIWPQIQQETQGSHRLPVLKLSNIILLQKKEPLAQVS